MLDKSLKARQGPFYTNLVKTIYIMFPLQRQIWYANTILLTCWGFSALLFTLLREGALSHDRHDANLVSAVRQQAQDVGLQSLGISVQEKAVHVYRVLQLTPGYFVLFKVWIGAWRSPTDQDRPNGVVIGLNVAGRKWFFLIRAKIILKICWNKSKRWLNLM